MTKPLDVLTPAVDAPPARDPEASDHPLRLDPRTYARGLACVHCGLCLPACPTYTENGDEADSPRGRIQLMLGLSDRRIDPTPEAVTHLDLCLDCRACETACPSSVVYHELIEETRARLAPIRSLRGRPPAASGLLNWMFANVFIHPTRLKLALLPARLLQKVGLYGLMRRVGLFRLLPAGLAKMEQMLPPNGPVWPRRSPEIVEPSTCAELRNRLVVAMFDGCIGGVMFGHVNRQARELLTLCGATVVTPRAQRCCGAIPHHNGDHQTALELARRNIDAFFPPGGREPDFICSTIAGCGAALREYDALLRDDPAYAQRARRFASSVRDITEVLLELGVNEHLKLPVTATATYHDACHLLHAQKVASAPRALLAAVPGLKMIPLPESDMCCGAAGTYNLTHPEMAGALAERKLVHIESTGAQLCVTGNVGCALHIASSAAGRGIVVRVEHPVTVLHRSAFGESSR
jgi:glycolate oxidase iron-sulfur subunit